MKTHLTPAPLPGFLTLPEVRLLCKEIITPVTAPFVLLQLQAGLRWSEAAAQIEESRDRAYSDGRVLVEAHGPRRFRRIVPVSPALAAWLAPYRHAAGIRLSARGMA
jgi:integrase